MHSPPGPTHTAARFEPSHSQTAAPALLIAIITFGHFTLAYMYVKTIRACQPVSQPSQLTLYRQSDTDVSHHLRRSRARVELARRHGREPSQAGGRLWVASKKLLIMSPERTQARTGTRSCGGCMEVESRRLSQLALPACHSDARTMQRGKGRPTSASSDPPLHTRVVR